MDFWTFFLYFVGALCLIKVIDVVIVVLAVSIKENNRRASYHRQPTYQAMPTKPKLFPDHKKGELANKLGDLSKK